MTEYIETEYVNRDCVKCLRGGAMIIVGEEDDLHRLGFDIAYLMHDWSSHRHSEGLSVRLINSVKVDGVRTQSKLYVFMQGGYLDNIYDLVRQRIREGFQVEIELKNLIPWSIEYVYHPSVPQPSLGDMEDLSDHPF